MHIHGGQLNPNQSSGVAQAALAARRAESTRKKLSSAAFELDALASPESSWSVQMAQAWPDGQPGNKSSDPSANPPASPSANPPDPSLNSAAPESQSSAEPLHRSTDAPVSFWA